MPPKMDLEEREFARRFGSELQAARLERDISQERLAEMAGVSTGTVGRWERGENPPKSYQLAKVWAGLNEERPLAAERLLKPADDLSEQDRRRIADAVAAGEEAGWRPRRRATKRVVDAPAAPRPRPRKKGRPGSTRP